MCWRAAPGGVMGAELESVARKREDEGGAGRELDDSGAWETAGARVSID